LAAQRGKRLNLLAAMLPNRSLFSAQLWTATVVGAFVGFLGLLKQSLAHLCKPIAVILDNASIHKGKASRPIIDFFGQARTRPLYSSAVQP
jgi:hypothetical protein